MGLLDDYGIDMDEIEAPSFDIPDDIYEFEVSDFFLQQGTNADPEKNSLVIEYSLGGGGRSKREWFGLPKNAADPSDKELQALGFFKNRLKDLGVAPEDMNGVEPDDIVGKTGTLQVYTNKGYQNIKNVKLDSEDEPSGAKEGPGNKASTFVGEDAPAAPKRPRRPAAAPEPPAEEEDEPEEPETPAPRKSTAAAATAKARQAGVRANPFG